MSTAVRQALGRIEDLAVLVDLATLATDPADGPIYFRVLNPQDGTATLSADGHTVIFVPAFGYTGPASFQYIAAIRN